MRSLLTVCFLWGQHGAASWSLGGSAGWNQCWEPRPRSRWYFGNLSRWRHGVVCLHMNPDWGWRTAQWVRQLPNWNLTRFYRFWSFLLRHIETWKTKCKILLKICYDCQYTIWVPGRCELRMCKKFRHTGQLATAQPLEQITCLLNANVKCYRSIFHYSQLYIYVRIISCVSGKGMIYCKLNVKCWVIYFPVELAEVV